VKQPPGFDGLLFDLFPLFQDGPAVPEVDVSGREVLQAFVTSPMVKVVKEGVDLLSWIAGRWID